MKINLIKVLIVLTVVLLLQAWLMTHSKFHFAEFPDQLAELAELAEFPDQLRVKDIIWNFSRWVPDTIERKFYQISRVRQNTINLGGNTLVDEGIQLVSVSDFIIYAPRALYLGLLSPLPRFWSGEGSTPAMTMARKIVGVITVVFYICLVGFIASIQMFRRNPAFLAIIVICLFGILLYSYTHPNTGTLLRYRYGFYMLLVVFGASNIVQALLSWFNHRKS